ncbi:Endoribonuclease L-PSP [Spironucleus salmonicida]|uniref:Endoribonuclease L-PSP n=1 Tax=Spironucleus salmonicida TaxID=348837 RepID=V6LM92_9EUKA|nr:Endoribonuclease L-PSP [Spironucleus salmonicida]|eukprot:EST45338.1 Endoribonuclease L-PSP [Spironucleus salmonicida]
MPKPKFLNCPSVPQFQNLNQATIVDNKVLLAGMVGMDTEMNIMNGLEAQAHKTFSNMKTVLEFCGSDLQHIISLNIYLDNSLTGPEVDRFNEIYREYFPVKEERPIRCCVQVKLADILVEIVNTKAFLKD